MIFQKELIRSLQLHAAAMAIESDTKSVSYAALDDASGKIAQHLLHEGLPKETPVGVILSDRIELITAMIAVFRAGCVFVPVDGTLPRKRIAEIVQDANIRYIISSAADITAAGIENNKSVAIFFIENILDNKNAGPNGIRFPEYDEDDSLYIYFTSGSTGKPKGIVGRNGSLLQFLQWEISTFELDHTSRVSQLISPYFDAFLRDVFAPLLAGGAICIPPSGMEFFTPANIIPWIDAARVTLIHCVPTVFRLFNQPPLVPANFQNLRYVLLSGERIIPSELTNWYTLFGSRIQLVNLYGTTETTMIRSYYLIRPEDVQADKIPIGFPIWDTELRVAGKNMLACEPLVPGDLYIITQHATKGYLNLPELTSERFKPLNEYPDDKRIAFRTGDKARKLPDGKIVLTGREDRQIKLNGVRIEPEEIESVLGKSGLVANAVVMHTEGSLIAFVIRSQKAKEEMAFTDVVHRHLTKHLPAYMIPAQILEVDEFPLLSNGKINFGKLTARLSGRTIVAPANETEQKILSIWKEILGDRMISVEDKFHSIGGNSLGIIGLISRLQKAFNVKISLGDLFQHLTIRKQAAFLQNATREDRVVISPCGQKPLYHASMSQERMYFNYLLDKESTAYNMPMAWEIISDADKSRIENAVRSLIGLHESLRTSFVYEQDRLFQRIQQDVSFTIEEVNGHNHSLKETVSRFIRPFDLSRAPLIRCGIITTEDKRIVVVDVHHIVCDGISQMILCAGFLKLLQGEQPEPLTLQYKDYAEWEYHVRTTNTYVAHRGFWLKQFDRQLPGLLFPLLQNTGQRISERGGSVEFSVSSMNIRAIEEAMEGKGITSFSIMFSLLAVYIHQLTGREDIIVGVAASNRMQQETEQVVGMFVKTLPVRCQVNAQWPFIEFAWNMHQYLVEAYSNQVYDLADIIHDLNRKRDNAIVRLFDIMFVFHNYKMAATASGDVIFSEYPFDNATSKYPLTFICYEDDEWFHFRAEYLSDYFTKEDVQFIARQFNRLVGHIAKQPHLQIMEAEGGDQPVRLTGEDISFKFD